MSHPLFTILLPVHRNADLLPFAVESVLAQTINSFELFIVCDGAPADTIECANDFSKKDPRIRVFDFPKGKRHGEIHRHTALMQANGQYVAYIADDDLWLPNHLEEMNILLQDVDFGNLFQTAVDANGNFYGYPGSLNDPNNIQKMLNTNFNFFGPTVCGYRLSAYKALKQGWSPAPDDIWTDLYMWRKFLSTKGLKFGSRLAITSLNFPASLRKTFSEKARKTEIENWSLQIKLPSVCQAIVEYFLKTQNINNKISAIISVHNGKKHLKTAINSVISQTLSPCELIIIDDESTDNSIQSIKDITASFPIRIYQQKNTGESAARNYGASLATGKYLAFLDQDDLWYPHYLEQLINPFSNTWRLGWAYSNPDEIDENNHVVQIGLLDQTRKKYPQKSIVKMLNDDMFILPSASLILKKAFQEVGGFTPRLCDSEKMKINGMTYAKKLLDQYPGKSRVNKFWAKDFLNMITRAYFIYCVKIKDFNHCKKLLNQLHEYTEMLPKKNQKKWKCIALLLRSPRLCYFLWDKLISNFPIPVKKFIQNHLMVHLADFY